MRSNRNIVIYCYIFFTWFGVINGQAQNPQKGDMVMGAELSGYPMDGKMVPILSTWGSYKYKKWSVLINPVLTKHPYGRQILGTTFEEAGFMGRVTNSILRYESNELSYQLGRTPINWGQSINNSIILSGTAPSFDHGLVNIKSNIFRLEFFSGQLHKENTSVETITRWVSGHRLLTQIQDRLFFEIGELIIYTGADRHFELHYANPLTSYLATDFDGESTSQPGLNNDNIIIFINSRANLNEKLSLFGEFIIDDYQVHDDPVQDMLGYKLGIDGSIDFHNYPFQFTAEYTKINSWTYIHEGQFTTFQNRGFYLGYPYGGDLRSFYISGNTWFYNDKLQLKTEYTWLEKGANNLKTEWANENTLDDPFPSKPVKTFHLVEVSVLYQTKYAAVEVGYTNIPFPYEIANGLIDELEGGLFLNLQLSASFDLKPE